MRVAMVTVATTLAIWAVGHAVYYRHQPLYAPYPEPSLLLFKLQYFMIGILIHEVSRGAVDRARWKSVFAVCLALSFSEAYQYRALVILEPMIVAVFFALAMESDRTIAPLRKLGNLLGSAPARIGADVSYAVYLFHGIFLSLVGRLFYSSTSPVAVWPYRAFFLWLMVILCTYGISFLVHYAIEKPSIAMGGTFCGARLENNRAKL